MELEEGFFLKQLEEFVLLKFNLSDKMNTDVAVASFVMAFEVLSSLPV